MPQHPAYDDLEIRISGRQSKDGADVYPVELTLNGNQHIGAAENDAQQLFWRGAPIGEWESSEDDRLDGAHL
ncbi:MAG: hypothetical protein IMY86_12275 [Chloroflexi bacterium]|jgi:hypothetical protein|nr:hypothetical protein [Chloroflexota bacterium]